MMINLDIFDNSDVDWSHFASGYNVSNPIGKSFQTPLRIFPLNDLKTRDGTTWYKFNISTNLKQPAYKWYRAGECQPCPSF